MNLPASLLLFLQENFNGSQVQIIDANWRKLAKKQMSLDHCTREQVLNYARTILKQSIVK